MPRRKDRKPTGDWRDNIARDIPDEMTQVWAYMGTGALGLIKVAAYNRRMTTHEFMGRAALAFAVYDSNGEITWEDATDKEPPLRDVRRLWLESRRLRGHGFGAWKIRQVDE